TGLNLGSGPTAFEDCAYGWLGRGRGPISVVDTMPSTALDAAGLALRELRRALEQGADPFDPDRLDVRDPALIEGVMPLVRAYMRGYLRAQVEGTENLGQAPVLYVSNHNGGIVGPDLVATLGLLWEALGPGEPVYALAHDFAMRQARAFGRFIQRFGGIRAARSNAERVLESGARVLVYPGGDLDAYRHYRRRNEVVFGDRTGFVLVARKVGVPIVPIVVHGAHRSAYIFNEGEAIARLLDMPRWARLSRFPLALALPWGIAAGPWVPYFPLPLKLRLRVLPAIHLGEGEAPEATRERVREAMQVALTEMAREAGDLE
ncbi:MAG TPA: 1-acyl-sn-glycerol-3-phosphate acyltransferase, partial [Polyangiaceae bacterium]|nr:1-acyl-sn-glycerol-3-phosphate acyltransferase [Polyangiaceae bacterium]